MINHEFCSLSALATSLLNSWRIKKNFLCSIKWFSRNKSVSPLGTLNKHLIIKKIFSVLIGFQRNKKALKGGLMKNVNKNIYSCRSDTQSVYHTRFVSWGLLRFLGLEWERGVINLPLQWHCYLIHNYFCFII